MHAVYTTNATWTGSQVVADLVKLISGTTTISSLSASCNQAATSIVTNTVAADWTAFDTSVMTNGLQIVSRAHQTGSVVKYVGLDYSAGLRLNCYTSWNATTHVGTDTATQSTISGSTTTNVLTVYLWVKPSYIVFMTYNAGVWYTFPFGAIEVDRSDAILYSDYWAESNTKSLILTGNLNNIENTSNVLYQPRAKSNIAAGDVTTTSALATVNGGILYANIILPRNIADTNNGVILAPVTASTIHGSLPNIAYLGKVYDLYQAIGSSSVGMAHLDEVSFGGKTYQILFGSTVTNTTNSPKICVPKE